MPTTIRMISVKGRPQMQIITSDVLGSIRVNPEWKTKLKRVDDHTLQVPANIGYHFFEMNKDKFGSFLDSKVEKDSLEQYYGFKDLYSDCYRCSTTLTENFINMFAERGDTLIRHEVNVDGTGRNGLGMYMPEFESRLYTNSYFDGEVGDITQDELQCFINALGADCGIVKEMCKVVAQNAVNDDVIDSAEKDVVAYETEINQVIEKMLSDVTQFKDSLPSRDFDCGFTIVRTSDSKMKEKYEILKQHNRRTGTSVQINFPDEYMNCSKSYKILAYIQEQSKNQHIKNLYVETILD